MIVWRWTSVAGCQVESIGRSAAFAPRVGLVYSPREDRKTIIRAGGGLFYDRVPLLAADFLDNPTRVVSFYDETGALVNSLILQNAYVTMVPGRGLVQVGHSLDTSPRNSTWNFEVDREVWRNAVIRISYLYSHTQDIYVVTPTRRRRRSAFSVGAGRHGRLALSRSSKQPCTTGRASEASSMCPMSGAALVAI